jgi:hypothetical protein
MSFVQKYLRFLIGVKNKSNIIMLTGYYRVGAGVDESIIPIPDAVTHTISTQTRPTPTLFTVYHDHAHS